MEGQGLQVTEAVIDNGKFGSHTIRFEAGLLAQQADGSAAVYLDEDTMLLAATTAGKTPRDAIDFFPLTVDVEERMYAAGKIPGSFFRREGRPSTEAILVCRLIDRPLRPSFVDGLRNEVQIVITVLSIAPGEFYDALAINAASIGIVPDPQSGSRSAWSGVHPDWRSMAAANVSRSGARATASR